MNNMELWNKVSKPPLSALKTIKGGRLSGMTDINPQWRMEALTEHFGPCGVGWYYTIDKLWIEEGSEGQKCAFAIISLYVAYPPKDNQGGGWSHPIQGIGGSVLVTMESKGLRTSDEFDKMATTDAISVAAQALGFGAEIYAGRFDGSKYKEKPAEKPKPQLTSAHYEAQIDEIVKTNETTGRGYEELAEWRTRTEGEIQESLSQGEKSKLTRYYKSVRAILYENRPTPVSDGDFPSGTAGLDNFYCVRDNKQTTTADCQGCEDASTCPEYSKQMAKEL
jgi:hypothetical protein